LTEEGALTLSDFGFTAGKVSTGLMHATPGDMKSFKSSAESIALMVLVCERKSAVKMYNLIPEPRNSNEYGVYDKR
jgi:hypothetical protein